MPGIRVKLERDKTFELFITQDYEGKFIHTKKKKYIQYVTVKYEK
jgi:hypothetical protein